MWFGATAKAVVFALVALVALVAMTPAGALPRDSSASSFGPSELASPPSCPLVHAASSGDGSLHGFARCPAGDLVQYTGRDVDDVLLYVERVGSEWRHETSPYHGLVLDVADDGTATYVLSHTGRGLVLGVRDRRGTYAESAVLDNEGAVQASIVARAGRWWAVWTASGPLYQAGSLFRHQARQRITVARTTTLQPDLALSPSGRVYLTWFKYLGFITDRASGRDLNKSEVRLGWSDNGRWESVRFTAGAGLYNHHPRVTTDSQHVYVTFVRDATPIVARSRTPSPRGSFEWRAYNTPGDCWNRINPRITSMGGRVLAGWTTCGTTSQPPSPTILEIEPGRWTGPTEVHGEGMADSLSSSGGRALLGVYRGPQGRATLLVTGVAGATFALDEQ